MYLPQSKNPISRSVQSGEGAGDAIMSPLPSLELCAGAAWEGVPAQPRVCLRLGTLGRALHLPWGHFPPAGAPAFPRGGSGAKPGAVEQEPQRSRLSLEQTPAGSPNPAEPCHSRACDAETQIPSTHCVALLLARWKCCELIPALSGAPSGN